MSDLPSANLSKAALRKHALNRREQLPISRLSEQIGQQIMGLAGFRSAPRIFFYYPIRNEVDLRPLFHQCPDKEWFLPVVRPEQNMHFLPCPDIDQLRSGPYGTLEPVGQKSTDRPVLPPDLRPDDCLILPGLLFDRQGFRLGYGKGYYDRFLEAARQAGRHCLLLGAVPEDLLLDSLPQDPWDQPAHWIVTEREALAIPTTPAGESGQASGQR
jgi:5-formyltetrahydrofolate cyclo-ligase